MKKLVLMLLFALILCLLSGCQATSTIEVAKLSESETLLADMIAGQTAVFNLKMARETRTVYVNLYRLNNGAWEMLSGGGVPVEAHSERIVLAIDPDDGMLKLGHGSQRVSFLQEPLDVGEVRSVTAAKLSEKVKLDWETEAPVFLYIETGADRVSGRLSDFFHPEQLAQHDRVYALTVMVSRRDAK